MTVSDLNKIGVSQCAAFAICAMVSCGCSSSNGDKTFPRPEAFPRIEVFDSLYDVIDSIPIKFEANRQADIQLSQNGFNILYAPYRTTIYCSVSSADNKNDLKKIVDNRRERIELNIGGNPTEVIEVTAADSSFTSWLYYTPVSTPIPVQFLSVGGENGATVVSGSAVMSTVVEPEKQEAVQPIIDFIRRDITHSLKTLSQ